ncbi:hypothetical protein DHEL01_v209671 [Diaporthe helianthi]|uniref:Uncharacterized protein n=1 Tax=Diaporthe helianthi TaxID=158607 RepID=A0A2P5HNW8_DIAHE|nr:hypothetical protein DHEL01_v209671 [Diaporthe helianthi]
MLHSSTLPETTTRSKPGRPKGLFRVLKNQVPIRRFPPDTTETAPRIQKNVEVKGADGHAFPASNVPTSGGSTKKAENRLQSGSATPLERPVNVTNPSLSNDRVRMLETIIEAKTAKIGILEKKLRQLARRAEQAEEELKLHRGQAGTLPPGQPTPSAEESFTRRRGASSFSNLAPSHRENVGGPAPSRQPARTPRRAPTWKESKMRTGWTLRDNLRLVWMIGQPKYGTRWSVMEEAWPRHFEGRTGDQGPDCLRDQTQLKDHAAELKTKFLK